jgi:hypothetical protein
MKKQKIKYDGFLTESKLQNIISQIEFVENLRFNEKDKYQKKFEWDVIFDYHGETVVFEFDSHFHYQNPKTIINDKYKDMECEDRGWHMYRIPYFIQLKPETIKKFTPFDFIEINTDFKHGFIKSKKYPSGYCHLGIERFEKEFSELSHNVKNEVAFSLIKEIYKTNIESVVPSWFFKKYLKEIEEICDF